MSQVYLDLTNKQTNKHFFIFITERLKIALGLPDLNTYLIQRLIKLKIKYENIFNEKLTMYDETKKKY